MANEQRNPDRKGGQDRQGQAQTNQPGQGGQHRDDDKNRREQKDQERSAGQRDRKS
jgi:hypothetical protein